MNLALILHRIRKLFRSRKSWRAPKRAHVLFFGSTASHVVQTDIVLGYMRRDAVEIFDSEVICMPLFFRSLFSRSLYLKRYMQAVQPRVAVTCMDNDMSFWELKSQFPELTTVIIQTGWRSEFADCFGELKRNPPRVKPRVDYLLAYNRYVGAEYLKYMDAQLIEIGSYKNNHHARLRAHTPRALTFVSQWRTKQVFHPVFFYEAGVPVYYDQFYEPETALLPLLANWCRRNDVALRICANSSTLEEYQFFVDRIGGLDFDRIGGLDFDFLPRFRLGDSYYVMDRAMVIATIESTLAYEGYARGIKVGFFSSRGTPMKVDSQRFGWPGPFPLTGPFWTDHISQQEVDRILDTLFAASDAEWRRLRDEFAPGVMVYDPGNSRMLGLFDQLGVPLADRVAAVPRTLPAPRSSAVSAVTTAS